MFASHSEAAHALRYLVGSGTGAVVRITHRSPVSSSRHITRSGRISRTTRSCTLHDKGYGAYRDGAVAQEGVW